MTIHDSTAYTTGANDIAQKANSLRQIGERGRE